MIEEEWIPELKDALLLDEWFHELQDASGFVGGLKAVTFLKDSNLKTDSLRAIWNLVDVTQQGRVNKPQFYKIIRLVSISCSPVYAGSVPSLDRYYKTIRDPIPIPSFGKKRSVEEGYSPGKSKPCWTPIGDDKILIDSWFSALDSSGSGMLSGAAVAGFLGSSRLKRETLRAIWNLVDSKSTGSINREQFYEAVRHVALCLHDKISEPTMIMYQASLAMYVPLPRLSLVNVQAPHTSHPPQPQSPHGGQHQNAPTVIPQQPQPVLQAAHPSQPFQHHYSPNPAFPYPAPFPHAPYGVYPQQPHSHYPQPYFGYYYAAPAPTANVETDPQQYQHYYQQQPTPPSPSHNRKVYESQAQVHEQFRQPVQPGHPYTDQSILAAPQVHHESFVSPSGSSGVSGTSNDSATRTQLSSQSVEEEDFSDFSSANAVEPVVSTSPHLPLNMSKTTSLSSIDLLTPARSQIDLTTFAYIYNDAPAAESMKPQQTIEDDFDQIGEFVGHDEFHSASDSAVSPAKHHQDLLQPDSLVETREHLAVSFSSASMDSNRMRFFDDLAEMDLQAQVEEWDDFEGPKLEAASSTQEDTFSTVQEPTHQENPFDVFVEFAPVAPTAEAFASAAPDDHGGLIAEVSQPTVTLVEEETDGLEFGDFNTHQHNQNAEVVDDDTDFGNFESHDAVDSDPIAECRIVNTTASIADAGIVDESFNETIVEAGDTHAPVNINAPPQVSNSDSVIGEKPAKEAQEENDVFDFFGSAAVEDAPLPTLERPNFAAASSKPMAVLDLLSMDLPPSTTGAGTSVALHDPFGHGNESADEDFGDFASSPIRPVERADQLSSESFDPFSAGGEAVEDDFGDFEGTSLAVPSSVPISTPFEADFGDSITASSPSAHDSSSNTTIFAENPSKDSSRRIQQQNQFSKSNKQLTIPQLEALAGILAERHLYAEAYACAQQLLALRNLNDLSDEKRIAVDNDDLELAISLKKRISQQIDQLQPLSEEHRWIDAEQSGQLGASVVEQVETICLIDDAVGKRCKTRFIEMAPSDSVSLETRLQFALKARRSLRMAIVVRTSHSEHPAAWSRVLHAVERRLVEAKGVWENFDALNPADKVAAWNSPTLRTYVEGIQTVLDVGLCIAASCLEGLVNETAANRCIKASESFVALAGKSWELKEIPAISSLTLTSASSLTKMCSLSLRPSKDLTKCKLNGRQYRQTNLRFWNHELNSAVPRCDCDIEE